MSQGILSKMFQGPISAFSVTHNLVVKYNDLFILFLDSWTIISAVLESNCCINAFKYRGNCPALMRYLSNVIFKPFWNLNFLFL